MSKNLNLSVDEYFSTEPLNEVSSVVSEDTITSDEISSGFSVDDYFKDVTYQATFNEPVIPKPETKEKEPSDFWKGFDQQKSDVQNWSMILESKVPMSSWHNRYSKPLPEGAGKLEIFNAQELYGYDDPDMPKWADMSPDARRIRLLELFNNNLDIKYPNRNDPDREKTKAEIGGTMLGALTTPTSLAPIGKGWKAMVGIGAFFGFEWGVSESLVNEGEIDWKNTAQYTALGAVATPIMVLGGRTALTKFKKYKVEKNLKLQTKASEELLDNYDRMVYEAVFSGEKAADIPTKVNYLLGINVKKLREAQELTGRKTIIPTRKEADAYYEAMRYAKGEEQIKTGGWLEDFLGVVSTRIKKMDESLFHRIRQLEYNQHAKLHDSFVEVEPFLSGLNKIKNKRTKQEITLSLYNGDFQKVELILTSNGNTKLLESFYDTTNVLNNLHRKAQEAGLKLGYLENYFPREIKDFEGLSKFIGKEKKSVLNNLLLAAAKKKGSALTQVERGNVTNQFLLSAYPNSSQTTKLKKGRKIDVLPVELLKFYRTPEESLHGYIRRVITETEKVSFFDKAWQANVLASGADVEKSVGVLVNDLLERGVIKEGEQVAELSRLLKARFITGETAPDQWVQNAKNITYAMTLGNPISAMTQFGDLFLAAYKSKDLLGTVQTALTQSMNPFTKNKIRLQDYGFIDIAEEFASNSKSSAFMRGAFKWGGFRGVDRIGKETLLNRAYTNYTKQVKTDKGLAEFRKKWLPAFGDDLPELIENLKKGNMNSQDVRLLLWHNLSDMQPVSLSEMPLKYLENPNGRAFYMLKTFTLKQFDVMRRDAFQLMKKKGTRTEGAKNLLRYATYFTAGGMSSQALKDFIMGREYDVSDAFIDNMWKMIGFNKYGAEKLADTGVKGITDAAVSLVSVPTGPYINMLDDALNYTQYRLGIDRRNETEFKSIKSTPVFGSISYQYFFDGIKKDKERKKEERKKSRKRSREFNRQMNRLFP
jgi:hypothetical protein